MTGTPSFEGIAGTTAAVEYLASLAPEAADLGLTQQLKLSFEKIREYELELTKILIGGLQAIPGIKIWGIQEEKRFTDRVPTLSITHAKHSTKELAQMLAAEGIFVWSGNHYALQFSESCGLEPGGTLRIGLLHYNTKEEVLRLLDTLKAL
jgi:selenocysteine lyase/cysteine desulfurase